MKILCIILEKSQAVVVVISTVVVSTVVVSTVVVSTVVVVVVISTVVVVISNGKFSYGPLGSYADYLTRAMGSTLKQQKMNSQ